MSKIDEKAEELRVAREADAKTVEAINEIGMEVFTKGATLADLIREGSTVTDKAYGWGNGENACALSAAVIAARSRGLL